VPSGPTSRMKKGPQAQVTRKLSGLTGRMEMEKGPTGQMEKGPTSTRRMEKGSSEEL
jgi:hypothetical protein